MNTATYKSVTEDIVRRLASIVGPKQVIYGEAEGLEPYSHDETAEKRYASMGAAESID